MKNKFLKKNSRKICSVVLAGVLLGSLAFSDFPSLKSGGTLSADADEEENYVVSYQDVTGTMNLSNLTLSNLASDVMVNTDTTGTDGNYETRTVIVSLEGSSLISKAGDADTAEYISSYSGRKAERQIEDKQSAFLSRLDEAGIDYEIKYSYKNIDNALALTLDTSYVSEIKAMDGVESVVIGDSYAAPQAIEGDDSSSYTLNATSVYDTGIYDSSKYVETYGGKGMSVAILDTGLDYTHEAFRLTDNTSDYYYEYSKEYKEKVGWSEDDIDNAVAAGLNATGSVYISEKVPFAYDYADQDNDVYPSYSNHGTHVAGIIAGRAGNYTDKDGNIVFKEGYDKDTSFYDEEQGIYFTDEEKSELATEEFIGVAPYAQLFICKVFTDDLQSTDIGGATTEDILAALEDCITLGVDVVNMSLGTTNGFATTDDGDDEGEYMQEVYDAVGEAGICLVCAASNDYSSGYGSTFGTNLTSNPDSGTVGSPASYSSTMSVASISGKTSPYMVANAGSDSETSVYFRESSDENNVDYDFTQLMLDLAAAGLADGSLAEDYVTRDDLGNIIGVTCSYVVVPGVGSATDYTTSIKNAITSAHNNKQLIITLIKRGTTTFQDKVEIAMQYNTDAVIIYNNVAGEIKMTVGDIEDPVPTVSITQVAGEAMVSGATSRVGSITINSTYQAGPFMSDFSSWGSTSDLTLKPEITAHGGDITSAVPGGYSVMSGTSMATPNIAGLTANILSYIHDNASLFGLNTEDSGYSKEAMQLAYQLMMSTATTVYDSDGLAYSPRKQGAGLASLDNIVSTSAYLYTVAGEEINSANGTYYGAAGNKPKIELGEDEEKTGVYTLVFYAKNVSSEDMEFTLRSLFMTESLSYDKLAVAEQAYMLAGNAVWTIEDSTYHDGDKITLGANSETKIKVVLTLTDAEKKYLDESFANGMYVEGFLQLVSENDSQCDLSVPFMGFYGDWDSAPMLDYNAFEIAEIEQDTSLDDDEKPSATIWATQAYATYWNNTYVLPMGNFMYTQDEDADQIYTVEDHSAISHYNDVTAGSETTSYMTSYAIRGLYAGLLRDARQVTVQMTNAYTGEVMYDKIVYRVGKAYSGGGSTTPAYIKLELDPDELGLVENGKYQLEFKFYFNENSEPGEDDTFSFSFYVDYTAPVLQDARLRYVDYKENNIAKQRIYLDLDVYDNHYAMAALLCRYTYDDAGDPSLELATDYATPIYNAVKNGVTTVSIEITDIFDKYGKELYVEIDDYALNHSVYALTINTLNSSVLPQTFSFADTSSTNMSITIGKLETYSVNLSWDTAAYPTANLSNFTWNATGAVGVKNGEIVGLYAGSGTVTVSNGSRTLTINVTVTDNDNMITQAPGISFEAIINGSNVPEKASGNVDVNIKQDITLELVYDPWYYTLVDDSLKKQTYKISWSSNNESVASVDNSGHVTMHKKGRATILATLEGTAYVASVTLNVQEAFTVSSFTLTKYVGGGGVVFIPTDMNIMTIGESAFKNNSTMTAVIIPKTVTTISEKAFYGCTALKYVFFYDVFSNDVAQSDLTLIEQNAFQGCTALEYIDFGNNKTFTVADSAFEGCTSLKVIKGMENIGTAYDYAFANCSSLLGSLPADNEKTANERLELVNKIVYNGQEISGLINFAKETSEKTINYVNIVWTEDNSYVAPDDTIVIYSNGLDTLTSKVEALDIEGLHVSGSFVFENASSLLGVKTGQFTSIGDFMFYAGTDDSGKTLSSSSFTSVTIETANVGNYAFYGNNSLKSVTFSGVTNGNIGNYAFYDCWMTSVTFDDSTISSIGSYAFARAPYLSSFSLPNGLTSLGDCILSGTGVKEIELNCDLSGVNFTGRTFDGITGLSSFTVSEAQSSNMSFDETFKILYNAEKTKVILALSSYSGTANTNTAATNIANYQDDSLNESGIAESVTEIGNYAFANISITSITLPSSLEKIGEYAFSGSGLTSITIPSSVEEIGTGAFYNCTALGTVTFGSKAANADEQSSTSSLKTISSYAFANTAITNISIPSSVTYIGDYAFADLSNGNTLSNLTTFSYSPEDESSLGSFVFYNASALNSVSLGDKVTSMGDYVFNGCSSLTTITLPALKSLGIGTFYRASSLTTVTFKDSSGNDLFTGESDGEIPVTIGTYTFFEDASLTSVTLPDSLTEIGEYAFYGASLTSISIPGKVTSVGYAAFEDCAALTSVTGLNTVSTIRAYAFAGCSSLATIDISSAETLGDFAFAGIAATTVTIPSTLEGTIKETVTKMDENGDWTRHIYISYEYTHNAMGYGVFAGSSVTSFTVAEDNEYYMTDNDGVLYRIISDGKYELMSYPSASSKTSYSVMDGTVRIDAYAFAYLKTSALKTVNLPYSLLTIGDAAFYTSNVTTFNFSSVRAPVLESVCRDDYYNEDEYYLIYYGTQAGGRYRGYYNLNFGDEMAVRYLQDIIYLYVNENTQLRPITSALYMTYPLNGVDYDSYTYSIYFPNATRTNVSVLSEDANGIVTIMESWKTTDEISAMYSWTVNDENYAIVYAFSEIIKEAHRLYNNISSDATQVELVNEKLLEYPAQTGGATDIYSLLTTTESALKEVKEKFGIVITLSSVTYNPDSYKSEYVVGEEFDMTGLEIIAIYDDYSEVIYTGDQIQLASSSQGALSTLDRNVSIYVPDLDRTVMIYISVSAVSAEGDTGGTETTDPETGTKGLSTTAIIIIIVVVVVVVLAAAALVVILLKKKKSTKDAGEDENFDDTENTTSENTTKDKSDEPTQSITNSEDKGEGDK